MSLPLADDLRQVCPTLRLLEPLSRHTSLAVGGPADYYADVSTVKELRSLRRIAEAQAFPIFFLGAGSNLLVSDKGIRGLVIHLQGEFRNVNFMRDTVIAGAAAWMPALAKQAAELGLSGLEPLVGVPGTIGGGLVMNAGTREGVLGDVVCSVDVLLSDGSIKTLSREDLGLEYRRSRLPGQWVLSTKLQLKAAERNIIIARIDELLQYRARTQPLGTSNCGSVFKNPPNQAAARLIEEAGLKGFRSGGARISERHANFIVNEQEARAADVRVLMDTMQKRVFEKFGVQLEPEIKLVGEW